MSEINVQLKNGAAAPIPVSATVADALKQLDKDQAKKALAAKVGREEVDLSRRLDSVGHLRKRTAQLHDSLLRDTAIEIEPILPEKRDGLEVLRHSTAHLLAAAVLDLFPGTKLGIGPALLDDPRFGFFYDVIAPRPLTESDLPAIERRMREFAQRGLAYRRDEAPKAAVLRLFAERGEPLK